MKIKTITAEISTAFLNALINGNVDSIESDKDACQFMAWELGMYEKAKKYSDTWEWKYSDYCNYGVCAVTGFKTKVSDVELVIYA